MAIEIDQDNLKKGLLGLLVGLLEIIRDSLKHQALLRIESGLLSDEECNSLGEAFMDLDEAVEKIKKEQDIVEAVKSVRDGLDDIVDDVIDRIINPLEWDKEDKK